MFETFHNLSQKGFTDEQRADSTASTYQNTEKNNGQATVPNILPGALKIPGSITTRERKKGTKRITFHPSPYETSSYCLPQTACE